MNNVVWSTPWAEAAERWSTPWTEAVESCHLQWYHTMNQQWSSPWAEAKEWYTLINIVDRDSSSQFTNYQHHGQRQSCHTALAFCFCPWCWFLLCWSDCISMGYPHTTEKGNTFTCQFRCLHPHQMVLPEHCPSQQSTEWLIQTVICKVISGIYNQGHEQLLSSGQSLPHCS